MPLKQFILWLVAFLLLPWSPAFAEGIPCRFDERFPVNESEVRETEDGILFIMGEERDMQLLVTATSPYFSEIRQQIRSGPRNGGYDDLTALIQFAEYGPVTLCGVVPSLVSSGPVLGIKKEGALWLVRQRDDSTGSERELKLAPESKCYSDDPAWVEAMQGKDVFFPITSTGYILHCGW